jgi:hypothetical protein
MFDKFRGAVSGLVQQQKLNALSRENLDTYRDTVVRLYSDLVPDSRNAASLQGKQRAFSLSPTDVSRIHKEAIASFTKDMLRHPVVTEAILENLGAASESLGSTLDDLPPAELRQLQLIASVIAIQKGKLPAMAPGASHLNLQVDEVVNAEVGCELLDERVYREYVSHSSGMSMRIAKGVYYHVGSTHGRSIPHTQIVPVDSGVLSITSKRIAFIGANQNFSAPWSKILHVEPMGDGLAISSTNRKKTVMVKYRDRSVSEVISSLVSHHVNC